MLLLFVVKKVEVEVDQTEVSPISASRHPTLRV